MSLNLFGICLTGDCWKQKYEQECKQEIDAKTAAGMGPPPPDYILNQMYTDCLNQKMMEHQKKSSNREEIAGNIFSLAANLFGKKNTADTTVTPGVSVEMPGWAKAGLILLGVAALGGVAVVIYKAVKN